jgi:Fic family protein
MGTCNQENVTRKRYRLEVSCSRNRKPQYYLAKNVKYKDKQTKVKIYIGSGNSPPSIDELEEFREKNAFKLEMMAAIKRAQLSSASYKSKYLSRSMVHIIEEVRALHRTLKNLLTINELKIYEKNLEISYVHGTVSIEGNTLSLKETRDLFINKIYPKDKSLRVINEAQNFKQVINYRNNFKAKITLNFIKNLHARIMNNIDDESAGAFRRTDLIGIEGCEIRLCPSIEIESELKNIIYHYYTRLDEGYHPFEEAILFHHDFEMIHPFSDGNGRVGREVLNFMLMREGYPKLLLGYPREDYIQALELGDEEKYAEMVISFSGLIAKQYRNLLEKWIAEAVQPHKRTGQLRLADFAEV